MILFAITDFGTLVGLPSSLFCFGLIAYLLLAPAPQSDNAARVSISRFFISVCLAFAAIWFWLSIALPMLAWCFVLGDRNSWFYDYSSQIAALVTVAVVCVAFFRTSWGTVSGTYVAVLKWSPPLLLVSAAAVSIEQYLSAIDAFTADSAAQSIFQGDTYHRRDSMRLVSHQGPPLFPPPLSQQKTYWVEEGGKKVAVIVVWREWLPGWRQLRVQWFKDPRDLLVEAEVSLNVGDRPRARYCLEQMIANFPDTPAEREARRLLATKFNRR